MSSKKLTIVIFVIVVAFLGVLHANSFTIKYWQDKLLKPNQQWNVDYGTNPDDVLAFNVHQLLILTNAQGLALQELNQRLNELEPNTPADPNS